MTASELRKTLADKLKEAKSHSMNLFLLLKCNDKLILRLADIESNNTLPEILSMFKGFLEARIINNEDLIARGLSSADESLNAIYEYDYDFYPDELKLFKHFKITDAVNTIPKFSFKTDDLSHLYGYLIYIGSMTDGIVLFKKHYPVSLIKRDTFLLGAIKRIERFEKLYDTDIIRLNNEVQLLRVDDSIFIFDINILEKNMGFLAFMQKAAKETIRAIEDLDIISDVKELYSTLDDPFFVRKLSKIKNNSPIFKLGIDRDSIISFTKNTPELVEKFKYSSDGKHIELSSKQSKIIFLKLMNDVFLHSQLTCQLYEASAKDNLTQHVDLKH